MNSTIPPNEFIGRGIEASVSRFSDALTKSLISTSHTGNDLVSPLSLFTALAMLLAGTKGSTRSALSSTLKIDSSVSQDKVDSFHQKLITSYKEWTNGTRLDMANRMLVDRVKVTKSPLLPTFEKTVREKYRGEIESVDFKNGTAVIDKVNKWVKKSTHGLIEKLLDIAPGPDSIFMLLNAIFFSGQWSQPFNAIADRKFFLEDGRMKTVKFMSTVGSLRHAQLPAAAPNGLVMGVEIPYEGFFGGASRASMIILLPPKSLSVNALFKRGLVNSLVRQVINSEDGGMIELLMPQFKIASARSMLDCLKSMGCQILFSHPDLSGINGRTNLRVDEVRHATAIEVDVNGTKAAAATSIHVTESSLKKPPTVAVVDRPFAFVIYDNVNKVPIFMGKLADPSLTLN